MRIEEVDGVVEGRAKTGGGAKMRMCNSAVHDECINV